MNTPLWTRLPGLRWAGSAALVLALVAGCSGGSGREAPASQAPAPAPSASASGTPGGTGGGGGGQAGSSAADQLAGLFAGASRMDARLRGAAELINGGVRRDVIVLDPATVAAVGAIEPRTLVRAIPGGADGALLRSVLLVYSDLVSRKRAMSRVVQYSDLSPLPRTGSEAKDLITCLGNGHAAATRFSADLAAARALAARSAPVAVVAPGSRRAAELAVRVQFVWLANAGCDACGGVVLTELLPLVWTGGPGDYHGTLDGVEFRADYAKGTGWTVNFNAC
jgi:hypothetical protein